MSEITIEDLDIPKNLKNFQIKEKVFRRSLSYTKFKNISLDDVGKNFSILKSKITFESIWLKRI